MASPFSSDLAAGLAQDALERLVRYARVDTQAIRDTTDVPSFAGELDLSRLLVDELCAVGVSDAEMDEHGYVMGTLEATVDGDVPAVGLIAHVDVSPDAPGAGVEPLVHRDWDGAPIELPRAGTVLDPSDTPDLAARVGHHIVTSSGDTLLGADDKAGVAAIMAAVAHLSAHPELPRPTVRVAFTIDEEIGLGAGRFDLDRFAADCAYTLDASGIATLQDETFTAAETKVTVTGVDVHPGFATGKLVNAARIVGEILAELPSDRLTPETTQDREGFIHPYEITGGAPVATARFIVRDFDDDLLAEHVALLERTSREVVARHPRAQVEVSTRPQYPNMRAHLAEHPQVVEAATRAIRAEGLGEPDRIPIRGGTDGSILSARGLPTPNLFNGSYEYHSVREWASVQELAASAATIVRLMGEWTSDDLRASFA